MDSTTTVIVLLFVITILSSLGGNKGYTPPASEPTPPSPPRPVTRPVTPSYGPVDPTYFAVVGENARVSIESFISKYRNADESAAIAGSIMRHSNSFNVNPKLVAALIARESRFNPRAVSKSGAVGLGQLLPSTCKTVGIDDPYDIDQNAKGTVRYMKYLLDRFKGASDPVAFAIAGYLEGPNAVERNNGYSAHTASYIKDILDYYHKI
jgi:soluble lytic murein transglycosylase-like protein